MQVTVNRKDIVFNPDPSRVIARFLFAGDSRALSTIRSVLGMSEEDASACIETDPEGLFHASQEYFKGL